MSTSSIWPCKKKQPATSSSPSRKPITPFSLKSSTINMSSSTNITPPPADLAGKVILITGGTSGLGAASAVQLARQGPSRIYIAGRRPDAFERVAEQIKCDLQTRASRIPDIKFLPCDLSDLSSVRAAADHILAHEDRLDVLMANAGVAAVPHAFTRDGYEVQFATNHLGHALLVRKLLPLLEKSRGRVVSVASFGYRGATGFGFERIKRSRVLEVSEKKGVNFKDAGSDDDLSGSDPTQDDIFGIARWKRYSESKLANVVYAQELARRYPDSVVSVGVTPGFVWTRMVEGMSFGDRLGTRMLAALTGGKLVEPEEGARNQVWAATVDGQELKNGGLYDPVGVHVDAAKMSAAAKDEILGERLWEWTEREIERWL